MNERLEKEIKSWLELRGIEHDEFGEIGKAALHFYYLALEDVTEELEKRIAAGTSKHDISAEAVALDSFLDFVDQLKK